MANTTMSDILLDPLNELQELSQSLFSALSSSSSSLSLSVSHKPRRPDPANGPSVQSLFSQMDAALAAAINLAHVHQTKQRKMDGLKRDILELDTHSKHICEQLLTAKLELEAMLGEADKRIQSIEHAKQAALPYSQLLNYAERSSAFTSAPPTNNQSTAPDNMQMTLPPPLFFPPFPNEEKMRRGRLNAEAPLGQPGETHSVGRPPTPSPSRHQDPYQHDHHHGPYHPSAGSTGLRHGHPEHTVFDLDLDLNPDL